MRWTPRSAFSWLFDGRLGARDRLLPRWLFLRSLALVYFSAFFSLVFQICGLLGPNGILPAGTYLDLVAKAFGHWQRIWYAPSLLWWSSGSGMLVALCWAGMLASLLLLANLWPRAMLAICVLCFLSFVSAAQEFSGYQSDGMLLEAGFISWFLAPRGLRPRLGTNDPPSRASLFLLLWLWFRIYFESGAVKLLSGDPQWRNFTAMDEYYQNGPLPTWIGWYVQQLPHGFHAMTVYATLALELGLVWMLFLPRRWRIACFFIVTPWQLGVILTANYTFLNYLVLVLGFLLLDDRFILGILPNAWKPKSLVLRSNLEVARERTTSTWWSRILGPWNVLKLSTSTILLTWIFYTTTTQLIWMFVRLPLPASPIIAIEPFRIANRYGLFAVMTRGRYEIEFQGSDDGENWTAYPFRYKPQAPDQPPGIYAPYQPRFDWNLWFASLGPWRQYPIVPNAEVQLLAGDKDVLALFAGNPFAQGPPRQVRAVLWQYWFTSLSEKRASGMWWRRQMLGLYAPVLERQSDGKVKVLQWPALEPRD